MTDRLAEDQYATREPVPRHLRNPRRGYDETGRELRPMTIASMRGCGAVGIIASCLNHLCRREARIDTISLPNDLFVPDVALRLRCSACGSRNVRTAPDWSELSGRYSASRERLGRRGRGRGLGLAFGSRRIRRGGSTG